MVSMQVISVFICVSLVFILFDQVSCQRARSQRDSDTCPKGHRCRAESMCRPSAKKLIVGRPQSCGSSSRPKMCCPDPGSIPGGRTPAITPKKPDFTPGARPLDTTPLNSNPGDCGKAFGKPSKDGYVIGGVDAKQGAWPWMVAIMIANKRGIKTPGCTGFMIDRRHFLSAAHCFENTDPSIYSTRIGDVDLTKGNVYDVSHVTIHEGYTPGQFYNDIAVVTLSRDVDVPNFSPICLPSQGNTKDLVDHGTTVVGWGSTTPGGPMSLIQKQLSAMPVVTQDKCDSAYRKGLRSFSRQFPNGISSKMLCAGFLKELEKDSCTGDSGGPLMFQENNRWYAVGIVSFGYHCGRPGIPGGYTRVSEYVNWVNRNRG